MITNQPIQWPTLSSETPEDPAKLLIMITEINRLLENERNQEVES
jgi:hypothetical protein